MTNDQTKPEGGEDRPPCSDPSSAPKSDQVSAPVSDEAIENGANDILEQATALALTESRWHCYRINEAICWDKAKLLFARGTGVNEIAKMLNVCPRSLFRRRRLENWRLIEDLAELEYQARLVSEAVRVRLWLLRSGVIAQRRVKRVPVPPDLAIAPPLAPPDHTLLPPLWNTTAHPAQLPPDGPWRTWMLMGGRGAGKTRAGAEWIRALVESGLAKRIALVGPTLHDVREVMIDGPSGLRSIGTELLRPHYEVTRRRLTWPKVGPCAGAVAFVFSAEDPESLRGPQFDAAWCDEIGAWAKDLQTWNTLAFALRLGKNPRTVATTTPRPRALVKMLADRAARSQGVVITQASTRANAVNLAPEFISVLEEDYAGTELGRQELDGELIEDLEGALWSRAMIEEARAGVGEADGLERVVVAVDPPVSATGRSDACGIIVAGVKDGVVFVLADQTVRGLKPAEWAARVMLAAESWGAGTVVAESNQGGDMVRDVLERAGAELAGGRKLRVKLQHAHLSKAERAAPVSTLYAKGRVRHVRVLKELEDEMCSFGVAGDDGRRARSPDRVDALVWAVDELKRKQTRPRLNGF